MVTINMVSMGNTAVMDTDTGKRKRKTEGRSRKKMRSEKGTQSGIPNREMAVRTVDTREYVSILRELVQEGKEVQHDDRRQQHVPLFCAMPGQNLFQSALAGTTARRYGVFMNGRTVSLSCTGSSARLHRDMISSGDAQIVVEHGVQPGTDLRDHYKSLPQGKVDAARGLLVGVFRTCLAAGYSAAAEC